MGKYGCQEKAPAEGPSSRRHGPQRKDSTVDKTSVPKTERLQKVRALALKEAIDRFENELLPDEERMLLLDRIKRLRQRIAA
jgi:hypothetical protein